MSFDFGFAAGVDSGGAAEGRGFDVGDVGDVRDAREGVALRFRSASEAGMAVAFDAPRADPLPVACGGSLLLGLDSRPPPRPGGLRSLSGVAVACVAGCKTLRPEPIVEGAVGDPWAGDEAAEPNAAAVPSLAGSGVGLATSDELTFRTSCSSVAIAGGRSEKAFRVPEKDPAKLLDVKMNVLPPTIAAVSAMTARKRPGETGRDSKSLRAASGDGTFVAGRGLTTEAFDSV